MDWKKLFFFLPILWVVFSLNDFWCIKVINFNGIKIIFCLFLVPLVSYLRPLPSLRSWRLTPMFSSKIFIILALIFTSLLHFELIFIYGVRKGSNFILLYVHIQLSQHHWWKKLFLLNDWLTYKYQLAIDLWVCL